MKIVFFVENGKPTNEDFTLKSILTREGNKVTFSNGSVPYGFQDTCGKVVMSKPFEHIIEWCKSKGIEYSVSENAVDMEDAVFTAVEEDSPSEEAASEGVELREKYFELFGKKAGNMKLENIKAAIEEKEQEKLEEE